ncbi:MAG: Uma2 family endonuclease [Betaproteobacteria bacterium]|nr:Uma2 family endonuclease [Betaproteobacteria bacterium]
MSDLSTLNHYKLTIEEYHKLAEVGILNEDSRVELIEGELIQMAPIGPPHWSIVNRLTRLLVTLAGDQAVVSVQNSVRLPPNSEPQPDFVIARPEMANIRSRIAGPADTLLVIEVADTTLAYDRGVKLRLYAKSGIPEFWIVNVQNETIEVYGAPTPEGYQTKFIKDKGDYATLKAVPGLSIDIAKLFA